MVPKRCRECNREVDAAAQRCPHCGAANPAPGYVRLMLGVLFVLIAVGALYSWERGARVERWTPVDRPTVQQQMASELDQVYDKVALDAVDQYHMVYNHGTGIDRCVHAGFAAAAFLQARDIAQYAHWRQIQTRDCTAAGLPGHIPT